MLADVRREGVDAVVIGGDVVPGPMPLETLLALQQLDVPTHFIHGNGDRYILRALRGLDLAELPNQYHAPMLWCAEQLREHEATLASWPPTLTLDVPKLGQVLFCHATPRNDTEIVLETTSADRMRVAFAGVTAHAVICGHTHMQFDRQVNGVRVVNAGSVGMPFGAPGAYWLLLGPQSMVLRRTEYDLADAARRVRATAFPDAEGFATGSILEPPSVKAMLERFSPHEVRE